MDSTCYAYLAWHSILMSAHLMAFIDISVEIKVNWDLFAQIKPQSNLFRLRLWCFNFMMWRAFDFIHKKARKMRKGVSISIDRVALPMVTFAFSCLAFIRVSAFHWKPKNRLNSTNCYFCTLHEEKEIHDTHRELMNSMEMRNLLNKQICIRELNIYLVFICF